MIFIVILLLTVSIAVVVPLVGLTARWFMDRVVKQAADRFRDADEIVNQGRVPEVWTHSFSQRIDEISRLGAAGNDIECVGRRAHKHCLQQIDSLIRFLSKGDFFDSPETRATLLESLHEKRDKWSAGDWRALIEFGADS